MKIQFDVQTDKENNIQFFTNAEGNDVLRAPLLNKGTGFTKEERDTFHLNGLIPARVLTIDQQIEKVYQRFHRMGSILNLCGSCDRLDTKTKTTLKKDIDIIRYNYLRDLQDRNELLFYAFAQRYLEETIPIIYTPTVGEAVLRYSKDSARFRGVFLSPDSITNAQSIFKQFRFKQPTIAVVTDNQGILGLGDQGVGGMNIPIGKLALYVLGAGIRPWETMPISLDVGTDNLEDLEDPYYLGYKAGRLQDKDYMDFIDRFVTAIKEKFPYILVQWEDFSRQNAFTILDKYRYKILSFNDDIQGTGSVAVAGILNGLRATKQSLEDQNIVIYGAGAGGVGIARRLVACLTSKHNLSNEKACSRIAVLDSKGLVTTQRNNPEYKKAFEKDKTVYQSWDIEDESHITLLETIKNFHPTILIGTSGKSGHFTKDIIKAMCQSASNPIIFPLSNPTANSEATPKDIYNYSNGKALVATGSPFEPFQYKGKTVTIGQGNNFFIFPGVGLGAILSQGQYINDSVFTEVCYTLSDLTAEKLVKNHTLYPPYSDIRDISAHIALTTTQEIASDQDTAEYSLQDIKKYMWKAGYYPLKKIP
ncbi:MAG: oxaloacetate-decarboxylating malate dehydrogenase [Thermoplasmatota archaeon]